MRIGAHVSIAKSLDLAVDRAVKIGAQCIQVFGSGPQQWQFLLFPEAQIKAFKQKAREYDISPIFVHSIYLINLASENPYVLGRSLESLIQYLRFASQIGAEGVVFHVGSHKGKGWEAVKGQVFQAVTEVLKRSVEDGGYLILENSAGAGGIIGAKFAELGEIIRVVGDSRVRVGLDTAHAFESGYAFSGDSSRTSSGFKGRTASLDETLEEFDREIGLGKLILVHANDSKTPFASGVDRHENLGAGHIGIGDFELIVNHSSLCHLPFIIETPCLRRGSTWSAEFDKQSVDKKNLDTLKRLAKSR